MKIVSKTVTLLTTLCIATAVVASPGHHEMAAEKQDIVDTAF